MWSEAGVARIAAPCPPRGGRQPHARRCRVILALPFACLLLMLPVALAQTVDGAADSATRLPAAADGGGGLIPPGLPEADTPAPIGEAPPTDTPQRPRLPGEPTAPGRPGVVKALTAETLLSIDRPTKWYQGRGRLQLVLPDDELLIYCDAIDYSDETGIATLTGNLLR